MAIARTAKPKLAAKAVVRWDRFSKKNILLYPERGLSLNDVASAIVRRCDGTCSVEAIIAELCSTFPGADPADVERDVMEFLEQLRERTLLEGVG